SRAPRDGPGRSRVLPPLPRLRRLPLPGHGGEGGAGDAAHLRRPGNAGRLLRVPPRPRSRAGPARRLAPGRERRAGVVRALPGVGGALPAPRVHRLPGRGALGALARGRVRGARRHRPWSVAPRAHRRRARCRSPGRVPARRAGADGNDPLRAVTFGRGILDALGFTHLAAHDAQSLRRLGWFVTPLAVALGVLGLVALVRDWRREYLFSVLTALSFSGFYFYKLRVYNDY